MSWALLSLQRASTLSEWIILMLIGGICIVASAIDLRTFLLPNVFTYSGAVIVLGASYVGLLSTSFADSLSGAIVGPFILWAVAALFKLAKNMDGLGFGDVKFMVMLGGFVGWQGLSWLILIASISALIFALFYLKGKDDITRTPIPFGPFLALGACVTYVYLPKIQALL
ncbi:A24 family peptidase [Halodesulfovibrio sp.]|uniref:prepilin peptidase n=1 Tax=Halodesulfovibrio sp. TaxID=1912772 RepID=UPI0025BE8BED|nr:A24 family peptidase [Halodesulfovibrio sp.]